MSVHQLKDGRWYVVQHRDKDRPKNLYANISAGV
jgi:hypothetical protein